MSACGPCETWRLLTEAERERVSASARHLPGLIYTVEHPVEHHAAFVAANLANFGHVELETVDLRDGWVRTAYRLNTRVFGELP